MKYSARRHWHCVILLAGCLIAGAGAPASDPSGAASPPPLHWVPLPPIPDPEGFGGGFAGVSNGALLFAGGANFSGRRHWQGGTKRYYDVVYMLPSPRSYWRPIGKLPRPIGYGVSGSFRGEVIVAGGTDLAGTYDSVIALSWDGRDLHCRSLPSLPGRRAFAGGTMAGHTLYVACGIEAGQFAAVTAMRNLWALDLADAASGWRELAPLPGPGREYPVAATLGEDFYIFGGVALKADGAGKQVQTVLRDAYRYHPGAGWSRLAEMPRPVAGSPSPAAVTAGGQILISTGVESLQFVEGPDEPGFLENGVVYDPRANQWSVVPEVPVSRSTAPTTLWCGMWVMIAGERKAGYRSPEVWGLRLGVTEGDGGS